jgi:hypothetical protein
LSGDQDGEAAVLNVLLTEFQAIREEILGTINTQYTILSLGTGLLAGLLGVALSQSSNPASVYLLLLVPFVSVSVSALWAVEGIRRLRASSYVRDELAPKIEAACKGGLAALRISGRLLGYEFFLRESGSADLRNWNNSYYRLSQLGVQGIFIGSGLAAWALAVYLFLVPDAGALLEARAAATLAILLVELAALVYVGYKVSSVVEAARTLIPVPKK